tara:strand:- start:25 stop:567 length:543 start_codon:yes stop_codon:yes gene_type:complete
MSAFNAAFDKLSLGEVPDFAALVAKNGAHNLETTKLCSLIEDKDEKIAKAAMNAVIALMAVPDAEAYVVPTIGSILSRAADRDASVRELVPTAAFAVVDGVNPFALKSLLPFIFSKLPVEQKWQIREVALNCITRMNKVAPRQLGNALPEIVPEVTACMWDTKKQVKVSPRISKTKQSKA